MPSMVPELTLAEQLVWMLGSLAVDTILGPLLYAKASLTRSTPRPAPQSSGQGADARPELLCVGDSLTAGSASADWVSALARAAPGWAAVNAGVNSQVSAAALSGVGALLAAHPRAAAATLLIGTNDVLATLNTPVRPPRSQRNLYMQQQRRFSVRANGLRPDADFTLDGFIANVRALVKALASADCRVALVTLPPIGEELDSATNARASKGAFAQVREYNEALQLLAWERGLVLLDLHAALAGRLGQAARPPRPFRPALVPWEVLAALTRHALLGLSWDRVAAAGGRGLLTDGIHFSDGAGALLADLVAGFLAEQGPSAAQPAGARL